MTSFFRGVWEKPLFVGIFVLLFVPAFSEAAVIRSSRDTISVPDDSVVPGDFYALGRTIKISGAVEGDLYIAGGTVTVTGPVSGDVVILGGRVSLRGPVGDDVRVVGGEVSIEGTIGGDLFAAAEDATLEDSAHVSGDLFFYGNEANVIGDVAGIVYVRGEELSVNGSAGSLDVVTASGLSLGERAHIVGDLVYEAPKEIDRAQDSTVGGEVTKRPTARDHLKEVKGLLLFASMTLFASLLTVLLFRERLESLFMRYGSSVGVSGFAGLGFFVATPFAIGLLLASLLGLFASLFLFLFYLGVLFAAGIMTSIFTGAGLLRLARRSYRVNWFSALLGVAVVQLLFLVPVAGPVVLFTLFLATLGMVVRHLYDAIRS